MGKSQEEIVESLKSFFVHYYSLLCSALHCITRILTCNCLIVCVWNYEISVFCLLRILKPLKGQVCQLTMTITNAWKTPYSFWPDVSCEGIF